MKSLCSLCSVFDYFTADVISLLQKRGIYTINDFLRSDNRYIERISALTYQEISELKRYITKSFSATPINALRYYHKILLHSALIPTGIQELDNLLQGGLFTGTIYEICSPPYFEKTFLILAILKNVLLENSVLFLDTKQEFSGKYMKSLLNNLNKKEDCIKLMKNIFIKYIATKHDLISALFEIKQKLENGIQTRIIIIHYLPTLFLDTNNNTENNNVINHLANVLRYIASQHHVVIIITNLITTWIDGDFRFVKEITEKVACGKYWSSIPNIRLRLNREKNNMLQFTLVKHNNVNNNSHCLINLSKIIV